MRSFFALAAGLSALIATRGWAVCDSTEACLRAIEDSQRAVRTLTARFEQIKHLSLLAEPLVSHGRFAFKQPEQILWQINDPQITVRIDRQGVHLPNLPNAEAEVAAVAPFGTMLRELSGVFTGSLGSVQRAFDVQAQAQAAGIHVHLVPRDAEWQRMFRSIDLTFATPDMTMKTIHLEEALGDSLDLVFSDVHRNDAAADALFAGEK